MKKRFYQLAATVSLLVSAAHAGITVSSPANGSNVGTPVHFVASASSTNPIVAMKVYVDNNTVYSTSTNKIDTYLAMPSGTRNVVVQSWDSKGYVQKQALKVNVAYSTTTQTDTSSSSAFTNIDHLTGWQHCDACAGIGGAGPQTAYSYTQGLASPAMDGKSMQFWLGGSNPYSNALWWKQLGPKDSATNFVYDVYFYMKDPGAAQALEFDVNQSLNGRKFIFGTECNLVNTKTWRIWDTANVKWINSGIPCARPSAYAWHHLQWEFKRSGNSTVFVAVTLDGKKSYVNRTFNSRASSAHELNVAFQMDGNYNQTDYSTWLDKVTLKYW